MKAESACEAMRTVWFLLLLVPLASGQPGLIQSDGPTDATLWVHLDGPFDAPMNTQQPHDDSSYSNDIGLVQHSQSCVDNPFSTLLAEPHHTRYAYVNPSAVDYSEERIRYHQGRGLGYDLALADHTPVVHWSLQAQWLTAEQSPSDPAPATPNVVLRASLREGDQVSVGSTAYNEGTLIASGQSEPANLHPQLLGDHPHVRHAVVDGAHVFDFTVPLQLEEPMVRAEEGLNLRIDVYIDNPACSGADTYIMPDTVREHSSPEHRPRVDLQVLNPIRIESLFPQVIGDDVVVNAQIASVWGSYDLADNPAANGMTPSGMTEPLDLTRIPSDEYNCCHGWSGREAVSATWVWAEAATLPEDGVYAIDVAVPNRAGTAQALGHVAINIGTGDATGCAWKDGRSMCTAFSEPLETQTPGIGLVPLVGVLGVLAFLSTRRA